MQAWWLPGVSPLDPMSPWHDVRIGDDASSSGNAQLPPGSGRVGKVAHRGTKGPRNSLLPLPLSILLLLHKSIHSVYYPRYLPAPSLATLSSRTNINNKHLANQQRSSRQNGYERFGLQGRCSLQPARRCELRRCSCRRPLSSQHLHCFRHRDVAIGSPHQGLLTHQRHRRAAPGQTSRRRAVQGLARVPRCVRVAELPRPLHRGWNSLDQ